MNAICKGKAWDKFETMSELIKAILASKKQRFAIANRGKPDFKLCKKQDYRQIKAESYPVCLSMYEDLSRATPN
ncbi:hypothetical protein Cal6303_2700 [Calothrix sp. PCC 6303]|nr:hypothetical protein Cal6303_2700 [Calothrix sp. PCC 6303]